MLLSPTVGSFPVVRPSRKFSPPTQGCVWVDTHTHFVVCNNDHFQDFVSCSNCTRMMLVLLHYLGGAVYSTFGAAQFLISKFYQIEFCT